MTKSIFSITLLVKAKLCGALCKFVTEIQKHNAEEYDPNSIKDMMVCIQMYLATQGIYWKLLSDKDDVFMELYNVVDNMMKALTEKGKGVVKSATPVTSSMEEQMWKSGVLGEDIPSQLADTVMFLLGINLALRGGEEQKHLRRPGFDPQITISKDGDGVRCLIYRQDPKHKTNQGGLSLKHKDPKVVYTYQHPNCSWCPVRLYKKYVSLLPEGGKHGDLYLYGKKNVTPKCWYDDRCIGIKTICTTVKHLCCLAGLPSGNFRNHSLHASTCTHMFQAHQDERLIKHVSGHKSNAVRQYKHVNDSLHRKASTAIQGISNEVPALSQEKRVVQDV